MVHYVFKNAFFKGITAFNIYSSLESITFLSKRKTCKKLLCSSLQVFYL